MLQKSGMDQNAMAHWHAEFETRTPDDHAHFLLSLRIPGQEVTAIRNCAANCKIKVHS